MRSLIDLALWSKLCGIYNLQTLLPLERLQEKGLQNFKRRAVYATGTFLTFYC